MKHTVTKKQIALVLSAMAALSAAPGAYAQTAPNSATSFSNTVTSLQGIGVGSLPPGIQTVKNNLNSYLSTEQTLNAGFVSVSAAAQADVTTQQGLIDAKVTQINSLIAANPLDPQIATEQANLANLQADLATKNAALATAQAAVTNSDIKISLYQQAINGPVTTAEQAAAAAAAQFTNAATQFANGGDRTSPDATLTGAAGLQSVVDSINGVTAGDQAPVINAITAADAAFPGAAAASVSDIQALVGVINAQLPTLPPISSAAKDAALQSVLNGSYERNAIDTIQSNGIEGIVSRDPATGAIHIGENSLITNEVGGVQELYAQNASANPININVTNGSDLLVNGVSVATDADVAAEATARQNADVVLQSNIDAEAATRASEDTAIRTEFRAADVVLQNNIDAEAATRASEDTAIRTEFRAADVVLQNNIDAEAATRASEDTAIRTEFRAADVVLQSNIDAEAATRASEDTLIRADIAAEAATRSAADTQLQANIDAETAARIADVNAEESRALAAEAALSGRATALEGRTTALEGRTSALEGRMGRAESEIRSLRKGIAMAAALQTPVINKGDKQAVKVGAATYDGEQGLGLGYAVRVGESVTVNVDVATGFPETVARGGVNLSF